MLFHIYKSRRFRKSIQKGHRNLESQQNDNISRLVGETSLKQEKLQNRTKLTKCCIHFHNFPESSVKYFYVASHLQVSKIPKNQIKKGHRNLEYQQNDNIARSVGERSLKQEKLQKRSKLTKCYIHFHNFSESSAKYLKVVSHLQVSRIPKIKSEKGTGT